MTIKMRLDTDGLRALIKDNPQIELEIGREVLNNISTDTIKGKIEGQIEQCLKGLVHNAGSHWTPRWVAKAPELTQAVKDAAQVVINDQLEASIARAVEQAVGREIGVQTARLRREMLDAIKDLITPEVARDIVREKILP